MTTYRASFALLLLLSITSTARPQAPLLPPASKDPLLRLEAGGPTSPVRGLAFNPDGTTLYAAGWDKVARVWTRDARGDFQLDRTAYRVPLGPGFDGVINTLAVSSDGTWLAVAGKGLMRGRAGFDQRGLWIPAVAGMTPELNPEMRADEGMIYVFNTRTQAVRLLRGHQGPVLSLAFSPSRDDKPPLLVSAAREWDGKEAPYVGGVRLWDLAQDAAKAEVDQVTGLADPRERPPGLAVWPTGKQPRQVLVALAWGDGSFRLWDVEQKKKEFWKVHEGIYNTSIAYLPERGQVLTAARQPVVNGRPGYARVRLWNVRAGAEPQVADEVTFPDGKEVVYIPRALTPFSSKSDGKTDQAAVVLRAVATGKETSWLQRIEVGAGRFQAAGDATELWEGTGDIPDVTAAPRGRHLAVTGQPGRAIAVFSIADLLAGRAKPAQLLRSAGTTLRYAGFLTRGKEAGLLLSTTPPSSIGAPPRNPQAGDLVFDFAGRSLTAEAGAWKRDAPTLDGWRVELAKDGLVVTQGGRVASPVRLPEGFRVTSYALLPPGRLPVPLLAVASLNEFNEPVLHLYDVRSGELLSQLTGHLATVRSVAFSADGRLLVSAADDQTVCVWTLVSLAAQLGQLGQLPGVLVNSAKDGTPVVGKVALDGPARGKLQQGERIEGLVEDGKLRPLATAVAFHEAVSQLKPGKTATLSVLDAQGRRRQVTLDVVQAADERKPLLTLFVTRAAKPEEREWLAWNPVGPYDSSDPAAERHLGWHRNTGKPDAPTSFALADQYRKDYYRKGLLKHLVARASLAPALKDLEEETRPKKPPRPPGLTLLLEEDSAKPKQVDGRALLRGRPAMLRLAIDDFDLEQVETVEWQLDDAAPRPFAQAPGRERSADLSGVTWQRGVHTLRAVVRSRGPEPQQYTEEITVQYQPPPPVLTSRLKEQRVVEAPALRVGADVRPGLGAEKVSIRFLHRHKEKVLATKEWNTDKPIYLSPDVELQPGDNLLEFVAVNRDALKGHEELETARQTLAVAYKKKVLPPLIALEQVVSLTDGAEESQAVERGKPVVVTVPRVRIVGKIQAEEKLTRAEWARGRAAATTLAKFEPGKSTEWAIREELTLEPGPQTLHFRARATDSEEAESTMTLDYRPPLPRLVLTVEPAGPILLEGKDAREVQLKGRLIPPADRRPFQAKIVLNDKDLDVKPVLDEAAQTLTARIPLQPGENKIQVRLSNEWKVTGSAEARVTFRRPPRVVAIEPPRVGARPLVDVIARVESAKDLPLTRAEINGRELPADALTVEQTKEQLTTWKVVARDVPLEQGENTLRLTASNKDATCLEPGTVKVTYTPPPPPKARVDILDPRQDAIVETARYPVRFRIQSSSPLRSVTLAAGRQVVFTVDVAKLKKNADGGFDLVETATVILKTGPNPLQVVAINDGGEATAAVTLSYVYKPVKVVLDKLERRAAPGEFIVPEAQENNRLHFSQPLADGKVWVHGRVIWLDPTDTRLTEARTVRVWVNGYQQVPAELQPRSGDGVVREFRAEVLLNRREGNHVEIELPGLPQEAGNRGDFTVDCRKPERDRRLHLLIVAVGERNEKKLKARVFKALDAQPTSATSFTTPAFTQGRLYGPLTDEVSEKEVRYQLYEIRRNLELFARGGAANDVVMVYYQGGETDNREGQFFWTSVEPDRRRMAASREGLERFFAEALGAHILLLDVARDVAVEPARGAPPWPAESRAVMLRYAWQGRDAPEGARLITALEEAMPRASKLREVDDGLLTQFRRMRAAYPRLDYDRHLPADAGELVVGRAP